MRADKESSKETIFQIFDKKQQVYSYEGGNQTKRSFRPAQRGRSHYQGHIQQPHRRELQGFGIPGVLGWRPAANGAGVWKDRNVPGRHPCQDRNYRITGTAIIRSMSKKASIGKPFLLPGERKTDCLTLAIRNLYIRNLVSLQLDYPDGINRDICMQVVIIHFLVIITFVRIGSIVTAVMLEVKFQFA